jgi:hypothetical protein
MSNEATKKIHCNKCQQETHHELLHKETQQWSDGNPEEGYGVIASISWTESRVVHQAPGAHGSFHP